jgi:hypothetical protein
MNLEFLNLVFPTLAALVGFPALLAALINVSKLFGLPDGYAPKVSLVVWLIGFVGVFYLVATGQVELLKAIDVQLGIFASFLLAFGTFATEIGLTKIFNQALKGVPWIGFNRSK